MTKILTHNGRFHADEVFAVAILKIIFQDKIEVLRTRDLTTISKVDFVLDIGRLYDPSINRYDHHQDTFTEKRENNIPYATAGLIWKHYGTEITKSVEIVKRLDLLLIQAIDAEDNGVECVDPNSTYNPYMLSDVTQSFRRSYDIRNEETDLEDFLKAVEFAKELLIRVITKIKANIDGEEEVEKIINSSEEKNFIVLDRKLPWEEIVMNYKEILYVIQFNDISNNWSVYAVRQNFNSFVVRKPFPKEWGGKEGESLVSITGNNQAIFCHKGLFLTVTKTKESAIKLTKLAIKT